MILAQLFPSIIAASVTLGVVQTVTRVVETIGDKLYWLRSVPYRVALTW